MDPADNTFRNSQGDVSAPVTYLAFSDPDHVRLVLKKPSNGLFA
jgi:hypothetical protein